MHTQPLTRPRIFPLVASALASTALLWLCPSSHAAPERKPKDTSIDASKPASPAGKKKEVDAAKPSSPALANLPRLDKVTQHHVTWFFSESVPVGQFVNGDYYVVGPVTITGTNPAGKDGQNLSAININPDDKSFRAFDKNMRYYDPKASVVFPITLQPGNSIMTGVSTERAAHRCLFDTEKNFSTVLAYHILTVLPKPVAPDAFRPGYADRQQRIYYARNLQRWRLNNLAHVEDTPDIARWAQLYRQPWLDLVGFCRGGAAEYQPQYARETARAEAFATLLLNLDFPPSQKEPLLVNFVQYGIDLWSIVRDYKFDGWQANGGHGTGRKWAIVFSGMMLGDKEMASPSVSRPDFMFGQDMQTAYGNAWTGAKVVYAGHRGLWKGEPVSNKPAQMPYEHLQPKDWTPNTFKYAWRPTPTTQYEGEVYRRVINSPVWVGLALAGRIMHAEPYYAHDAFFDYVDRWMDEAARDDEFRRIIMEQIDAKKSHHNFLEERYKSGRIRDPFVEHMWQAYRHKLPPQPAPPGG